MKFYRSKRFSRIELALAPILFFTMGCGASDFPPMTGQHHSHTDYNAPHTIVSTELTSFFAHFHYNDPLMNARSGAYSYDLKKEGTVWKLKTNHKEIEVSQEVVNQIENLIRAYDLAALNGVHEHTDGLPPGLGEYAFRADYASGESISADNNRGSSGSDQWTHFTYALKSFVDPLLIK